MKPLTERMTKGGAAKTWIKEVEAKDREIERLEQTKEHYLSIIDILTREREALQESILDLWHKSGADHKGRNYGISKDTKATIDALLEESE